MTDADVAADFIPRAVEDRSERLWTSDGGERRDRDEQGRLDLVHGVAEARRRGDGQLDRRLWPWTRTHA